ncbi:MAG: M50 family metallopeptidase [Coriobacteriia bacterium]|jgi:regulator of sigma E protease|nr:M50 family metallopeptidase [Coriobacteriia bacterium]
MTSAGSTILWGVLTFSILVVIHEGGHFLAARFFGVKVHEFMVGLPGPALRFRSKRSGTVFGVTAIPLGGYVRIAGMEPGPEDELLASALDSALAAGRIDSEGLAAELGVEVEHAARLLATLADWGALAPATDDEVSYLAAMSARPDDTAAETLDLARSVTYRALSKPKRITVLSMGVIANLLTALLVFTTVLSVWGYYTQSLTLYDVAPDSGAAHAGLQAGDRIAGFDGDEVADWPSLTAAISHTVPGDVVEIEYLRHGDVRTTEAVIGKSEEGDPVLGVVSDTEHVNLSVPEAAVESVRMTGMVFAAIGKFFSPSTFQESVEGARSIVGISIEVAEAARTGPLNYAWMVALLSLSLGAMNILPIPPLDGGKIAVELIEAAAGRPLGRRFSLGLSLSGAMLLFSLIGYLMYADVVRYFFQG